jgi:transposase
MYYIGLDVHKRKISFGVKDGSGRIHAEGSISATRLELDHWMRSLPQPWSVAMEATIGVRASWGAEGKSRVGVRIE